MTGRDAVRVWLALTTVYVVCGSTFIALAIAVRDLPPFHGLFTWHRPIAASAATEPTA